MDPFMEDVARRSPQEYGSTNEERGRVWHSRQSEKHNPRRRNPQPRMLSAGVGWGGEGVGRAESGSSWCVLPRGMAWRIEGDPRIVLGAPQITSLSVALPAMQGARETWVGSLGQKDPPEKGLARQCSCWETPWTGEPGRYRPRGRRESDTTGQLKNGKY